MEDIKVWDPLVRIFHWTLALACVLNLWLVEDGSDLHEWLGYYAAGAVVVRIVWGFIGTRYARFSSFFPTPSRLKEHLGAMLQNKAHSIGHNPLGGLMILGLMALVLLLGLTGWMMSLDLFWGEDWVEELHEGLAEILMVLVLIHVSVVSLYSRFGKDNLIKAMWTGRKSIRSDAE